MNSLEKQIQKRSLLDQTSNELSQARKSFNETQFEVNKERIISAEKAGWWSGAAISLSFTLIGYFMSNEVLRSSLGHNIFGLPIIYLVIVGWIAFLFSISGSVVCRLFNSTYLNYNKANYWASSEKKMRFLQLDWIISGYDFLPSDANSMEEAKNNIEESKKNYEELEMESEKKQVWFLKFTNLSVASTFAGVLIGFICLGIFLILITFRVIFM